MRKIREELTLRHRDAFLSIVECSQPTLMLNMLNTGLIFSERHLIGMHDLTQRHIVRRINYQAYMDSIEEGYKRL